MTQHIKHLFTWTDWNDFFCGLTVTTYSLVLALLCHHVPIVPREHYIVLLTFVNQFLSVHRAGDILSFPGCLLVFWNRYSLLSVSHSLNFSIFFSFVACNILVARYKEDNLTRLIFRSWIRSTFSPKQKWKRTSHAWETFTVLMTQC